LGCLPGAPDISGLCVTGPTWDRRDRMTLIDVAYLALCPFPEHRCVWFATRRTTVSYVRFEVSTAVTLKNVVFWDIKTQEGRCLLGCYAVWLL
jgi:hypothetical protein